MTGRTYDELTFDTFCANAIRSVMMIDDDFLSYDQLARLYAEPAQRNEKHINGSLKAANIHDFFQKRKIACDVDSGTQNLDPDRVRKCDLIVLDYHLENQDPSRSIELICALRKNDHLNLVVIYTSESLEQVWLQLAASLRGSRVIEDVLGATPDVLAKWDELTQGGAKIPEDWKDAVTLDDINEYLIHGAPGGTLRKAFGKIGEIGRDATAFATAVCEMNIAELNVISAQRDEQQICGENGDVRWLQSGNVFIALHSKSDHENDAPGIWNTLNSAIAKWSPTYYQLIISEVQNWLENEPLPFDMDGLREVEGQSAWLSSMLQESSDFKKANMVEQLLQRLTEELRDRLASSASIKDFAESAIRCLSEKAKSADVKSSNEYDRFSAEHMKLRGAANQPQVQLEMFHSLNADLCSRKFSGDHVTNGTVLFDRVNVKFYLCVSPACDAVPEQATSPLAERTLPHRLMKVLQLSPSKPETALDEAEYGRYIFVKADEKRYFLAVQDPKTHNPTIDYAVVHNHASRTRNIAIEGMAVSFLGLDGQGEVKPEATTLVPIAQLRDSYTARFQTVASHHAGRVGVDYVKFPPRGATKLVSRTPTILSAIENGVAGTEELSSTLERTNSSGSEATSLSTASSDVCVQQTSVLVDIIVQSGTVPSSEAVKIDEQAAPNGHQLQCIPSQEALSQAPVEVDHAPSKSSH